MTVITESTALTEYVSAGVQSGDLYATNPETGAVTVMHTSYVNATTEHMDAPGPVVLIQ
jgi:hypothetical protein